MSHDSEPIVLCTVLLKLGSGKSLVDLAMTRPGDDLNVGLLRDERGQVGTETNAKTQSGT